MAKKITIRKAKARAAKKAEGGGVEKVIEPAEEVVIEETEDAGKVVEGAAKKTGDAYEEISASAEETVPAAGAKPVEGQQPAATGAVAQVQGFKFLFVEFY